MNAANERRPGRPAIGATVQIRLPADLLTWVDAAAGELGVSRAHFIREALDYARMLEYPASLEEANR